MMEVDIHKRLRGSEGPMDLSIKFTLKEGEVMGLYGPSGAGKTSTLRLIAGLLVPDRGRVTFAGQTWYDGRQRTPGSRRGIGFVFQDYALFPHLSVVENLAYAAPSPNPAFTQELLEVFQLAELADRRPPHLSGGQQQRLALARALAQQPRLLLLDEPFAALDGALRAKLYDYLSEVKERFKFATIIISHDEAELRHLADRLIVLDGGRVSFTGPVRGYFPRPNETIATIKRIHRADESVRYLLQVGEGEVTTGWQPWGERFREGETVFISLTNSGVQIQKLPSKA